MVEGIETMEEEYERTKKVDLVSLCNKNGSARRQLNQINKELIEMLADKIKTQVSIKNFKDRSLQEFKNKFNNRDKYLGTEFFDWHHILTDSCLMRRTSFVDSHGLNLNKKYSVKEFISLCENDYGGEIIKKLKEFYD